MNKISLFTRFFWFCSGANTDILLQCPKSEHHKFVGVGATVFFTGLLAAFSGGYALYTVFQSWVIAILFALLWGSIIFNLDRFLVSSIKKEGPFSKQLSLAIPRFLLAAVLALVIAKPLELRIFESEILEILDERRQEKRAVIATTYGEKIEASNLQIDQLKGEIAASFAIRETNYADYKCECDGTCGTGKRGRGSECERKEEKYRLSQQEYLDLKAQNEVQINLTRTEIDQLKEEADEAVIAMNEVFSSGLLARLGATTELPTRPSLMITLLILLIEISPVLAKLLAPRGPYDDGLKQVEEAYQLTQVAAIEQQKQQIHQQQLLAKNLQQAELEKEIEQQKEAMQVVADAQLELVRTQINEWLEKEKAKLRGEAGHKSDPEV